METKGNFDHWFYYQTEYNYCSSCNNLSKDLIHPEGMWGKKFCVPCIRLAKALGTKPSKKNLE